MDFCSVPVAALRLIVSFVEASSCFGYKWCELRRQQATQDKFSTLARIPRIGQRTMEDNWGSGRDSYQLQLTRDPLNPKP